jgi:hypothetical protein
MTASFCLICARRYSRLLMEGEPRVEDEDEDDEDEDENEDEDD